MANAKFRYGLNMLLNPERLTHETNKGETDLRGILLHSFVDKSYIALHSVGLSEHSEKPYSEADFIVITDFGIFCLEVKGGNVSMQNGVWKIGYEETGNYYTSSDGPFKQASKTIDPILKKLKNSHRNRWKKFLIYWGVVFPHCSFQEPEGSEWKKDQVCDLTKINNFEKYLIGLGEFTKKRFSEIGINPDSNITKDDILWAANVIRKDVVTNNEQNQILRSSSELINLEEQQKTILDEFFYGNSFQMIMLGGAGTGKTLLCNQLVDYFSSYEDKILYLCFNKNLSIYLIRIFEHLSNVKVSTFHNYMEEYVGKEKIKNLREEENYFSNVLPDFFEDKIIDENEDKKFDILIVDEAQDILDQRTVELLELVFKKGFENGKWFLSIDKDIQSQVFSRYDENVLNYIKSKSNCNERTLYRNLRNPYKVVEKANSLFPDIQLPNPAREFTSFVKKFSFIDDNDQQNKLTTIIERLIKSKVDPNQISILTFKSHEASFLNGKQFIYNQKLKNYANTSIGLTWSNISSYKGLENDFIILVETPEGDLNTHQKALYYVALTRCKVEINILHKKNAKIGEL